MEQAKDVALEKHYTSKEIAKMWGVSEDTVRRKFQGREGVLTWGEPETRWKRAYRSIRIPESVVIRVHREMRSE